MLARSRARYPGLDHAVRAQKRYAQNEGDFYAAALTYFTIFAMFPLLMLGFAAGGLVLTRSPRLLDRLRHSIQDVIPGHSGAQLVDLMDSAVDSYASVGLIGLGIAAWAGLSWMTRLREAVSRMWGRPRVTDAGAVGVLRAKASDLVALVSVFAASVITIGLTALSSPRTVATGLSWIGVSQGHGFDTTIQILSVLGGEALSLGIAWLLFSWMISRLPREPATFADVMRAGWIAAIGFEVLKQVGAVYLKSVVSGPAGAAFGPVLGLMVFAYVTARLVLFATAWAAETEPADG